MTIRKVVYLPSPVLRKVGKPVEKFDVELHALIDDMFETMYHTKGVGLAAPQIGISLQLAVVDVIGDKVQQFVLANPKIIAAVGQKEYQEGCLSVPGAYDTVMRADKVTLQAQDKFGEVFEITADGLLGECFQHEVDHLQGKLFIDLLSPLKRGMARRRMDKYLRGPKS
ncbi:MAG: peptide deformylase [Legionellales bacterium RIFCSPHIGHO2_12_FULL_42_9]|nr:MAG: peptide deformylase [Legionellales bacterium RIFCSPHIGHO2_12_FULL_42_9]